jgi:hypothetical protein
MEDTMNNLAVIEQFQTTGLKAGTIKIVENRNFWVEIGGGLQKIQKASSCLVEPEINDKVLVFVDPDEGSYILSVLSRQSATPASIPFENGASIKINEGFFQVESPQLQLSANQKLSLSGAELKINASEGRANIEKMTVKGTSLKSCWDTIKLATRNMDTIAERWIQKVKRSYRTVEEFEESKIGRLRYLVKGIFFVKSEKTTMLSEKAVKIDGEKILLG